MPHFQFESKPPRAINPTGRQHQEIRSFDETGNWLTDVASASSLNQSRTHNKANEITDLTGPGGVIDPAHSAVGNMTTLPKPGAWTTSCALTWEAWNRPVTFNDGAANSYKYNTRWGAGHQLPHWQTNPGGTRRLDPPSRNWRP